MWEVLKENQKLEGEFGKIAPDNEINALIQKYGTEIWEMMKKIKGLFLANGGDIKNAIEASIDNDTIRLSPEEKEKLKAHLLSLLWDTTDKDIEESKPAPEKKVETSYDKLEAYQRLPEYETIKRLVKEGYIPETELSELTTNPNAPKDAKWIKEYFLYLIKKNSTSIPKNIQPQVIALLQWKNTTVSTEQQSPEINKEKKQIFERDFGEVKELWVPPEWDFWVFLAENHISIPSKNSSAPDAKLDLEATFVRSAKKLIEKHKDDFRATNSQYINIIFDEWKDIQERYQALSALFRASNTERAKSSLWRKLQLWEDKDIKWISDLLKKSRGNFKEQTNIHEKQKPISEIYAELEGIQWEINIGKISPENQIKLNSLLTKAQSILDRIGKKEDIPEKEVNDFLSEANSFVKENTPAK